MDASVKKARVRSVAYPSYTLDAAFDITLKVNQKFGNTTHVRREDISQELDISVGHLQTQLSSAGYYGLMDMKTGEGYKPSQDFIRIYKPISEEEKQQTKVECLLRPELYRQLIERFSGQQLPGVGGLAILLYRQYRVAEDASQKAAKVFLDNVESLGLVSDNILRLSLHGIKAESDTAYTEVNVEQNLLPVAQFNTTEPANKENVIDISSQLVDAPPIPIFLKGGKIARLIMPMGFTDEDLDKVIAVVGVYKNGT